MDFRWNHVFDNYQVDDSAWGGHMLQAIQDGPETYDDTVASDGITFNNQPLSLISFAGIGTRWKNCSKIDFIQSWYTKKHQPHRH